MTYKQIIIDGVDVSGCEYIIPPHEQCPNKPMPYAKETSCFACKEHNTKLNFCKNNPNCYYKQLKAKEQECEKLKERLKEMNEVIRTETTRCSLVNSLKTELDQLKEQLEAYKMEAEEGKEINAELKAEITRANCQIADDEILQCDIREAIEELKAENDLFRTCHDNEQAKRRKLEQTLTEIKEIAESEMDSKEFMAVQCMLNGSVDNKNKVLEQILQKISECEVMDE